jgi:hypothetical protein
MNAILQSSLSRRVLAAILLIALAILSGPALSAQTSGTSSSAQTVRSQGTDQTAEAVRKEFTGILRQYSPALGRVLALDPGLMTREDYLVPYPALAAYLKQHPEIVRNSDYYLSQFANDYNSYYYSIDPQTRMWQNMFDGIGVFVIILTIILAVAWLIRTLINYRRWGRQAKVQTEVHTKLMDRFAGNDELLAYVQSPAGSRFLQSAPIPLDSEPQAIAAPFSRILWALSAGVVLAALGVGLRLVSNRLAVRVDADASEPIYALSMIALSLGVGFIISAGLSFALSRRMGLFPATKDAQDVAGR